MDALAHYTLSVVWSPRSHASRCIRTAVTDEGKLSITVIRCQDCLCTALPTMSDMPMWAVSSTPVQMPIHSLTTYLRTRLETNGISGFIGSEHTLSDHKGRQRLQAHVDCVALCRPPHTYRCMQGAVYRLYCHWMFAVSMLLYHTPHFVTMNSHA